MWLDLSSWYFGISLLFLFLMLMAHFHWCVILFYGSSILGCWWMLWCYLSFFTNNNWFLSDFLEHIPLFCCGCGYSCFTRPLAWFVCIYKGNTIIFCPSDSYIQPVPHKWSVFPWSEWGICLGRISTVGCAGGILIDAVLLRIVTRIMGHMESKKKE